MLTTTKIPVSSSIADVSVALIHPENMKCLMTLAHGAGAGMNHSFMVAISNELAKLGIGTLRFNFPFIENKKGRPDLPAVAHKTIEAAIRYAHQLYPAIPLYSGGKSFGGRMTSQYLSAHPLEYVRGIVFFGFPLHPPGKPSTDRATHLNEIKIPMLFLQGTRDALADWDLIHGVCSKLKSAKLAKIEDADHSFKVAQKHILPELAETVDKWVLSSSAR